MSSLDEFFDSESSESDIEEDDSQSSENEWTRKISWSQFKTYQKCKKKWQLKYKDGNYVPAASINLIFGTAVHEAIQKYLNVLYNESVKKAERLDLKSILTDKMKEEFKEAKKQIRESKYFDEDEDPANHFEMKKYLMDGEKILKSFKSNRTDYFNTKETDLVGIELQVDHNIKDSIDYTGYLDVVLRNKKDGTYKILDIKTSKDGWDKWKKKDKMRVNQLVSYKMYYADVLDTDPKNIEVEYFILKRVLKDKSYFTQNRIQTFSPPSGSITQNKLRDQIEEFVSETYNSDGSRKEKEFEVNPGRFKCPFCEFSKTFGGEHPVCDEGGKDWEENSWPSGMKPYMDDKWIDDE